MKIIHMINRLCRLACLLSLDEGSNQVFHLEKNDETGDYYEQTKTLRRRQYGSEIFLPKLVATKVSKQTNKQTLIVVVV